jgi:tripartite-type tricarboxylate transporter receptor subunit TctC
MIRTTYLGILWALVFGFGTVHGATPYYEGKTVRLIVAFAPGGGFDTYSRAIGRHLGKHIPGNPSIIVDNMTGAGGIVQANYMFKQAKPDGLTIGNNIGGLFMQQIMGAKGIEFDGRKFE